MNKGRWFGSFSECNADSVPSDFKLSDGEECYGDCAGNKEDDPGSQQIMSALEGAPAH